MSRAVSSTPLLVVITGPSGVGKSTLCDNIRLALPGVSRAVTCTTRKPRSGELDDSAGRESCGDLYHP